MDVGSFFSLMPLWAVFLFAIGVVLFSLWFGFRLGEHRRRSPDYESEGAIGPVGGALLGLLAFLLAFTFGVAANRYDVRKELLLEEVNAIGTTYLRSELLPVPYGPAIRKMLREYVDIRAGVAGLRPEQFAQAVVRSNQLLDELWAQVVELSEKGTITRALSLFIPSLNDVIDFHTKRMTVSLQYRIPGAVWLVFYLLSAFAMVTVGYQFGLTGRSSRLPSALLALAFSVVILLIADLDRSEQGALVVSQQPMINLQHQLHKQ